MVTALAAGAALFLTPGSSAAAIEVRSIGSATAATAVPHLTEALPVDGYVVDPLGAPVAGATVLATGFAGFLSGIPTGSMTTTTAADGSFSGGADLGSVVEFSVSIPLAHGSYGPGGQEPDTASGKVVITSWRSSSSIGVGNPPTMTLPAIVPATVTVTDVAGRPAAGATVASPGWRAPCSGLQCRTATFASLMANDPNVPMSCTTDALGQCELPSLAWTSSSLLVNPLGSIPSSAGTYTMGSGATTFAIRLPRQMTIHGTISDSDGVPLSGASVTVTDANSNTGMAMTRIDGSYSFTMAIGLRVTIVVEASVVDGSLHPGGQEPPVASGTLRVEKVLQASDTTTLDLAFPRVSMMPVQVVDHEGGALAGTSVWVGASDLNGDWVVGDPSKLALGDAPRATFSPGFSGPFGCTTDATGTCTLPALDGATTQASIAVPSAVPFGITLVAPVDGTSTKITMPTPLVISGKVTDAAGTPVAGASVSVGQWSGSSGQVTTVTDSAGNYSSTAFAPGSYRWEVTANSVGTSFTGIGGGQISQAGSFHSQRNLLVSMSTTQNLALPPLVPVTFHALAGQTLAVFWAGQDSIVQAGPPTALFANPIPFTCTVNTDGACTVPGVIGMTGRLSQVGSDLPTAYVTVDQDPTEIWLVGSAGRSRGTVQLSSPDGVQLHDVSSAIVTADSLPSGFVPVAGQIAFTASGLRPGQSTSFTVTLPAGSKATNILKLIGGNIVDASSIATVVDDTVTIQATDGGVGDEDGVVNGTIVDPIVPVVEPPTAPSIMQSPVDVSVSAGQTASFVARATGSPVPTASWQRSTDGGASWFPIPGATGSHLAITTTTASDGVLVRAQFTNTIGTTVSESAALRLTGFHLRGVLPAGTVGRAYSAQLSATGGITPYKWKKLASLPKGLTLSTSGLLSGTINKKVAPGSYPISIQVTDATRKHPQVLQATWTIVVR